MQELVCKMCNSNEISLKDGMYVCESCGTKYTTEEAEKLPIKVVIKNDNDDRIISLLKAAKRAREINNWQSASKYYDEILTMDADNWEAVFYSAFCSASNSIIANLENASRLLHNSLKPTFTLIKKNLSATEQIDAVSEICTSANAFFLTVAETPNRTFGALREAITGAAECGFIINDMFGAECSDSVALSLKNAMNIGQSDTGLSYMDSSVSNKCVELLKEYDPQYLESREQNKEAYYSKNYKQATVMLAFAIISLIVGIFLRIVNNESFFALMLLIGGAVFTATGALCMIAFKQKK